MLTVIIPFLNEGVEVENTLESIFGFPHKGVKVMLVNDGSTDGYDYETVAKKFDAQYIVNEQRLGVAASRDLGVELCETPYFILLDGHMRLYTAGWVKRIVDELKRDERQLLCCQNKVLKIENGKLTEYSEMAYGAFIDFRKENELLSVHWITNESEPEVTVTDIPCVLGAAYACSKKYWQYLRGLQGLRMYGCDEQFISLKVWLEGGRCRLLKDVIFGHIYRTVPPYVTNAEKIVYNRVLISELLLPYRWRKKVFAALKKFFCSYSGEMFPLLPEERKFILENREYYRKIFTRDLDFVLQLNDIPMENTGMEREKDRRLVEQVVRKFLLKQPGIKNPGLLGGMMSGVLLLEHYSRYVSNSFFDDLAGDLMDCIYNECTTAIPLDFENGLCGVGWGIEYLIQNKFMQQGDEDVLEEIDRKIMERDPSRLTDYSLRRGLAGVLHYAVARLKSVAIDGKRESVFDAEYRIALKSAALRMVEDKNANEGTNAAYDFINYMETGEIDPTPLALEDLFPLPGMGDVKTGILLDLEKGETGVALGKMIKF